MDLEPVKNLAQSIANRTRTPLFILRNSAGNCYIGDRTEPLDYLVEDVIHPNQSRDDAYVADYESLIGMSRLSFLARDHTDPTQAIEVDMVRTIIYPPAGKDGYIKTTDAWIIQATCRARESGETFKGIANATIITQEDFVHMVDTAIERATSLRQKVYTFYAGVANIESHE